METTITTFSNTFTTQYSHNDFFEIIALFKEKARTKGLNSYEHILYNKIRDLPLDRGFTVITNKVKLANGAIANGAYKNALTMAKYVVKNKPELLKELGINASTVGFFNL